MGRLEVGKLCGVRRLGEMGRLCGVGGWVEGEVGWSGEDGLKWEVGWSGVVGWSA